MSVTWVRGEGSLVERIHQVYGTNVAVLDRVPSPLEALAFRNEVIAFPVTLKDKEVLGALFRTKSGPKGIIIMSTLKPLDVFTAETLPTPVMYFDV